MKNHFLKISQLCLFVWCSPFYAMNFAKKRIENPQERFLNARFDMVFHSTARLLDDSKKSVQEEIAHNNENFTWLFNVGTLLPDIQKHIVLKFCENNETLAEECLNLPIGALHDRKWTHDVMSGKINIQFRDIIERNSNYWHEPFINPVFNNEKKVFAMAKEIQDFEISHQKNFKSLSVQNLRSIQTIIQKSSCLENYSQYNEATCTIRKRITLQRLKKKLLADYANPYNWVYTLIAGGPLLIKSASRLIELFYCEKLIMQEIIAFNRIAQSVRDHLRLSKDPAVRGYYVPFKAIQDYDDFDYIKMYSPYALFLGYWPSSLAIFSSNLSYKQRFMALFCTIMAGVLNQYIERENALSAMAIFIGTGAINLSLFALLNLYLQSLTKKTIKLNQIGDLLKRTDIEIV